MKGEYIMRAILTNLSAGVSEFKKHPIRAMRKAEGECLAILHRNQPVFYCVPAKMYEAMIDALDDMGLAEIVRKRQGEKGIEVNINDL
jgi:antitoxin StbD